MGFSVRTSFNKLCLDTEQEERINNELTKDFYTVYLDGFSRSDINKMQSRLKEKTEAIQRNGYFCYGLFTNIAIDFMGNILPCIAFRKLFLGSVFELRSISDILASSQSLKELRSLRKKDITNCTHCSLINECTFCLGMMHTRNNNFKKPLSQYCTYLKTLEKYSCSV